MVGMPNNKKNWKKGTNTYDISIDMERRIAKELLLLDLEDENGELSQDIKITIDVEIKDKLKKMEEDETKTRS